MPSSIAIVRVPRLLAPQKPQGKQYREKRPKGSLFVCVCVACVLCVFSIFFIAAQVDLWKIFKCLRYDYRQVFGSGPSSCVVFVIALLVLLAPASPFILIVCIFSCLHLLQLLTCLKAATATAIGTATAIKVTVFLFIMQIANNFRSLSCQPTNWDGEKAKRKCLNYFVFFCCPTLFPR